MAKPWDGDRSVTLTDGRALSYAEYGDPAGSPVIGFHGMPGSRIVMKAFEEAAVACHARVIAPDRPGYGGSAPHRRDTLIGYSRDVVELADALALERFAVMGVSGGGPYALSCAHELPARVTVAAVVSGIGPLRLPDGMRDMVRMNRIMFTLGRWSPALTGLILPRLIKSSLPSMEKHARDGTSPTPDISPQVFAIMTADQKEAIRTGGQGIAYDMRNLWQPWGFRLEDIRARVCLWHGEADDLAPAMLAHHIAEHTPNCDATFYPGEGHTGPITKHARDIMARVGNS